MLETSMSCAQHQQSFQKSLEDGLTLEERVEKNADRSRRAHRNDLENVLPLIICMGLFVLTNPDHTAAVWLFRVLVAFRVWHSLIYGVWEVRQPARYIGFLVPWLIMVYMAIMVLVVFGASA